ncbi:MAG: DNA-protecting protein DprA [Chloroflexi bacterium]|nr:DNA-protecting protein DprA [Chloroflexota bacterium]
MCYTKQPVDRNERQYWVAFGRVPQIGRARFSLLEGHFSSMEEAWQAGPVALEAAGLKGKALSSLLAARDGISPDAELEKLERLGVQALCWHEEAYPARLKETFDKPPILYVRGELTAGDEWAVSLVGTRRATAYGRQAAEEMAAGLAANGITVVSGLARGIDTIGHRVALATGGRTIAALACGLDMVYPPENTKLAQEVMERGALVSDYPLGTQPRAEYFPRRNRIMVGLSLGVLVIEGDVKSGAMITARQALDENREVFAVPGSIYSPTFRGTNWLIQQGQAKLVTKAEDVLEELNLTMATHQMEAKELLPDDKTEAQLLNMLSSEPIHIDEVRRDSGLEIEAVSSALAMLELKGMVRQVGSMNYVKAREPRVAYEV